MTLLTASSPAAADVRAVPATTETTPVLHSGDAADDPAIWVHPTAPSRSLVIVNDKGPGDSPSELDTYDLNGNMLQRITTPAGFWGNVDVRQGVGLSGVPSDVVAVARGDIRLYSVDPESRLLFSIRDGSIAANGEGLCLYDSEATGRLYAFIITRAGLVRQVELTVSQEEVALWRYGAEPSAGSTRVRVDSVVA